MVAKLLKHPSARTLSGVLDEITEIQASAPAIFYFGETISYRDLQSRSREIARALIALGVHKGDRVAALLGNEPDWLTICFGCAYVGAIFVPLNTWYKTSEIDSTRRHCSISTRFIASCSRSKDFGAIL